jgi:hypothetical protein
MKKFVLYAVVFLGVLVVFGFVSLDTFMDFWVSTMIYLVKPVAFAAIPGGIFLGLYLFLSQSNNS